MAYEPVLASKLDNLVIFEPEVVSKDDNLLIAEPLATSKAPNLVMLEPEVTSNALNLVIALPEAVSRLPNLEFALPVYVRIEELNVLNEPVGTNCSLPVPFKREAFVANEADVAEPVMAPVIPPNTVREPVITSLPVTVSEPEMYGELSIILFYSKYFVMRYF